MRDWEKEVVRGPNGQGMRDWERKRKLEGESTGDERLGEKGRER